MHTDDEIEDLYPQEDEQYLDSGLLDIIPPKSTGPLKARRPEESTERFIDFNRYFKSLTVNWDAEAPYRVLASLRKRAILIGWDPRDLEAIEKSINLYTTVPRICPGPPKPGLIKEGDPVDLGCVCARNNPKCRPEVWQGSPCPEETLRIFQLFIQYIRSLEVHPTEMVDIQQVADIVKLHILEERCDAEMKVMTGMHDLVPVMMNRKGKVYYSKAIPITAQTQKLFRDQRKAAYKDLCATRENRIDIRLKREKMAINAKLSDSNRSTMASIMAIMNEKNLAEKQRNLIRGSRKENVLDTDYTDVDESYDIEDFK